MVEYATLKGDFEVSGYWYYWTEEVEGVLIAKQAWQPPIKVSNGERVEVLKRGVASGLRNLADGTFVGTCVAKAPEISEGAIPEVELLAIPLPMLEFEEAKT